MSTSKTIHKFTLVSIGADCIVQLPEGAEILSIQVQDYVPTLWALVDPAKPKVPRRIDCWGTGWEMKEEELGKHIATIQLQGHVWHYFDRGVM